jgi:hypothetical protein
MPEISENFEPSSFHGEIIEWEGEIAKINTLIAESRRYIERLRNDRESAMHEDEFAREHGYSKTAITELDALIQEIEAAIVENENLKKRSLADIKHLKDVHDRMESFLKDHKSEDPY